jgi:assimilatory nitrate reductase catalytic subunit
LGRKDGTFTNSERRVSKVGKAVEPPGVASSDFDIILALAAALGLELLFAGWTVPSDAFDEWRSVSAGRVCDYSGMTWEAIEAAGGIQWPFTGQGEGGTSRLYTDCTFATPSGKA